jgi:YD repeat-containing protein
MLQSDAPLTGALDDTQRATLYDKKGVLVDVYEYEPLVGMTKHYDNNGKMTSYSYDSFGRLTSTSDEMGGIQLYRYNLSGSDSPSFDMGDITITPNKPSSSIIPNNN